MIITAITPQQRTVGRYSIFIDQQFGFGVNEQQLIDLGLHRSRTLTEQDLREIEKQLEFDQVRRSALRFVELRMHSGSELRQKLRRKEFDSAQIEDVLEWLSERGLVDDRLFAERWIETRREQQGIGEYRLRQELHKKGIDKDLVAEALGARTESDEEQTLRAAEWASRRYASQLSNLHEQKTRVKIMTALVRRGFSCPVAKQAVEQLSAGKDE